MLTLNRFIKVLGIEDKGLSSGCSCKRINRNRVREVSSSSILGNRTNTDESYGLNVLYGEEGFVDIKGLWMG